MVNTRPAPSLTRAKPGPVQDTMWLGVCPLWTTLTSGWKTEKSDQRINLFLNSLFTWTTSVSSRWPDFTPSSGEQVCVLCINGFWGANSDLTAFIKTWVPQWIVQLFWSPLFWILKVEKQFNLKSEGFQGLFYFKKLKFKKVYMMKLLGLVQNKTTFWWLKCRLLLLKWWW